MDYSLYRPHYDAVFVKLVKLYNFLFCCVVDGYAVGGSQFGYSPAGIVLENVTCRGFENSPSECSYPGLGHVSTPQCQNPSTNAAGVTCIIQGIISSLWKILPT